MLGARFAEDVGARPRGTAFINERASEDIQVVIVLMALEHAHPVTGIPLHQHGQFSGCRIVVQDLTPGAGPRFVPVHLSAVGIEKEGSFVRP